MVSYLNAIAQMQISYDVDIVKFNTFPGASGSCRAQNTISDSASEKPPENQQGQTALASALEHHLPPSTGSLTSSRTLSPSVHGKAGA